MKNALDDDDQWALVNDAEEKKDAVDVGVDMSAAKSEFSDAANARSASCNRDEN
jgi:hypothetical protein